MNAKTIYLERCWLAIRKSIGNEALPTTLAVPIEEPGKQPYKRCENASPDFYTVCVAALLGCLDGNEMVPLCGECSTTIVSEFHIETTDLL
jgi:hypothetical protein